MGGALGSEHSGSAAWSLSPDAPSVCAALVVEAVNAYGTEGVYLSGTEKDVLVQEITESVTLRLQQMLPAYLAGYSAGASAPGAMAVPQTNTAPSQVATTPTQQESDDAMPDFGDSCMDFDFIGG